jgi:hypothetical protein
VNLFTLRTRWTPLTRDEIHCAICGFLVAMAMTGAFL